MRFKLGQLIYKKKWINAFHTDREMDHQITDVFFFNVKIPFEIKEFALCKRPSLLVGHVSNTTKGLVYVIADKKNI